jgi:hypothetical protein
VGVCQLQFILGAVRGAVRQQSSHQWGTRYMQNENEKVYITIDNDAATSHCSDPKVSVPQTVRLASRWHDVELVNGLDLYRKLLSPGPKRLRYKCHV